jgi:hypothetical protein
VADPKTPSKRRYPRAQAQLKATLKVTGNAKTQFEATLRTVDIGIGGLFFESTFFLKIGQRVDVELDLPPHNRHVHCRGRVIRVERLDERGKVRSGFAVKFDEYLGQSEVILANYFMAPVLRRFLQQYGKQHKLMLSTAEQDAQLDVLAAWELWKATMGDDLIWGGRA